MFDVELRKLTPGDVLMRKGTRESCTLTDIISADGRALYLFATAPLGSFACTAKALNWLMRGDGGSFLVLQRDSRRLK